MINSVEKIYIDGETNKFCFKLIRNNETLFVPNNEANTDYQAIQEWIADGGTVIDNGGGE
jgi:uncharacterized pyridoxamine 5'-phosphate oxidase family protein